MLSTTIHNDIRAELGLSVDEYLIAAAIDFYAYSPYNEEPWAFKKSKEIGELFNFSSRTMVRSVDTLVCTGVVEKSGHFKMRTTKLWREIHSLKKIANGAATPKSGENPPADSAPRKEYEAKMSELDHANWVIFWELYKTINYRDRENSCKVFAKFSKHFNEIMFGLRHYISDLSEKPWQEAKLASSWLNAKRWMDYEGKEEPKKIANGAADVKSPMDEFRIKCLKTMHDLFDGGKADRFDIEGEELEHGFSDIELKAIRDLGGFSVVMKTCSDGDFAVKLKAVWKGIE
ncbi:hypothetical protein [Sulfuricurvum sp.]|uniref:hypothetical protein n=1 Tax=Sulfuricurvum sp. TaxID=2025608 RepID=UPI00262E7FDD|nr:hypothetical protein [Sulfuricurvum sp.]MDD2267431.1 hypothetical protein [Sulfuricurvum sp.]MDD2782847.1 hypothetical protein [Sulfuricurvum sp.]